MVDITVQQIQSTPALAQQWQRTAGGRTNMPSDTPSWIAALKAAGIQVPPGTVPVATPDGISFTPSSQNFFGPGYGGSMSAPRAPTTFASNATPNSALPPYANPEGAPPSANMSGGGSGSGMPDWLKTVIKTGIGISPAIIGLIAQHTASGGSNGSGTGVAGGTGLPPALAGQFAASCINGGWSVTCLNSTLGVSQRPGGPHWLRKRLNSHGELFPEFPKPDGGPAAMRGMVGCPPGPPWRPLPHSLTRM